MISSFFIFLIFSMPSPKHLTKEVFSCKNIVMKKILLGALLFPFLCVASSSLEFELVKTPETPGFFAVTIFPVQEEELLSKNITFIKNFSAEEEYIYKPVIQFLNEIGAKVLDTLPLETNSTHIVSLGDSISESKNFHIKSEETSLEKFEHFSLHNLKPIFFKNLQTDFGGNISAVSKLETSITSDPGITFIGKFEKNMKTRMVVISEDENEFTQFEAPLDLTDSQFSLSPLAKQLPSLWEQFHQKKINSSSPSFSLLPWIGGGIILFILCIIFIRYTIGKYRNFLEQEDDVHEELPWRTVSSQDKKTSNNPFEVE